MNTKSKYPEAVICKRLIDFRSWLLDSGIKRTKRHHYVPVMGTKDIIGRIFSKVNFCIHGFEHGDDTWIRLHEELKPNLEEARIIKHIPPKEGWERGRQHSTMYYKKELWKFKIGKWGFDGYILHYPKVGLLPPHKDPVDGEHYRINLTLKGQSEFFCEKQLVNCKFIHIFRPDKYTHSLKILTETYKLSLGFAKLN